MICGGTVMVYFRFFDHCSPQDAALVRAILELLQSGQDAWLVSRMEQGKITAMGTFDETQGLRFAQLDEQMLRSWLTSSAVYQKGEPSYYVEPISRAGRVYIFGGGHVGRALVPVLANVGFRVTVFAQPRGLRKTGKLPGSRAGDLRRLLPHRGKGPHHAARLCGHHDPRTSGRPRGAAAGDENACVLRRLHRKPGIRSPRPISI